MFSRLRRRLGLLWGNDREDLFEALEFAHAELVDGVFGEDGVDGHHGQYVLDLIEVQLAKHERPFSTYRPGPDVPVT